MQELENFVVNHQYMHILRKNTTITTLDFLREKFYLEVQYHVYFLNHFAVDNVFMCLKFFLKFACLIFIRFKKLNHNSIQIFIFAILLYTSSTHIFWKFYKNSYFKVHKLKECIKIKSSIPFFRFLYLKIRAQHKIN